MDVTIIVEHQGTWSLQRIDIIASENLCTNTSGPMDVTAT